jgi:hypothetical protein
MYPRIDTSPLAVQQYTEVFDVLPPIEINQHNELIDGWHRWTAAKTLERESIDAVVTKTDSDMHLFELAIERNNAHGLPMTQQEKQRDCIRIYAGTSRDKQAALKVRMRMLFSVTDRTIERWVSRTDKEFKDSCKEDAAKMWLACHTQDEIAEAVGWPRRTVSDWIEGFGDLRQMSESAKAAANHAVDFDPPIYNIWKQQTKTSGLSHFGNSEMTWVDNLLYLYTEPVDIVIDPFAGSGSTREICRKRYRRYWISDRKIPAAMEGKIRLHDLTNGLPSLARWKDVQLVYLDPPYWKQAEGQYSDDPTDLANMPLDVFTKTLIGIVDQFRKKLSDAYIALLIQPTQWKAPGRKFVDHVGDLLRGVNLPVDMRFSCPYESQQCNAQMVDWAKQEKQCLVLTRELIVWRVD